MFGRIGDIADKVILEVEHCCMKYYLDQISFIVSQNLQSLITCMLISGQLIVLNAIFLQQCSDIMGKLRLSPEKKREISSFKCSYKVDIVLNN